VSPNESVVKPVSVAATPSRATGPETAASVQGKGGLNAKAATKAPVAKTTIRSAFEVAISPLDTLQTVPEFEMDVEKGTPRAGAGLGSGGLKSSSLTSFSIPGPIDPVRGPMIDFWMLSPDEAAPVEVEVWLLFLIVFLFVLLSLLFKLQHCFLVLAALFFCTQEPGFCSHAVVCVQQ
jgi:hypothetical protein